MALRLIDPWHTNDCNVTCTWGNVFHVSDIYMIYTTITSTNDEGRAFFWRVLSLLPQKWLVKSRQLALPYSGATPPCWNRLGQSSWDFHCPVLGEPVADIWSSFNTVTCSLPSTRRTCGSSNNDYGKPTQTQVLLTIGHSTISVSHDSEHCSEILVVASKSCLGITNYRLLGDTDGRTCMVLAKRLLMYQLWLHHKSILAS